MTAIQYGEIVNKITFENQKKEEGKENNDDQKVIKK